MILIAALLGLLVGALLHWASAILPRFSSSQPDHEVAPARLHLASLHWLASLAAKQSSKRARWLPLHAGVEIACAALFAYLWSRSGATMTFITDATITAFLLLVSLIDLKYHLVLNVAVYSAALVVVAARIVSGDVTSALIGAALAFAVFLLTARLQPGKLGGGDVKLAALLGLGFGFPAILWVLIVGTGLGGLAAVVLLARRPSRRQAIPYAPFLCFGALVALLYNPLLMMYVGR